MKFRNVGALRKGFIVKGVRFNLIVDGEQLHKLAEAASRYNTTISEIIRMGIGLILEKIDIDEKKS